MILKPSPADVIEQYLGSLEAIGIDLRKHDIKFEEDNWEAPTLGAWGIGWQVMLDGLEITQFTYFQQCGGIDLDLVPAELTYGLERLTAFLQVKDSVYDIEWTHGLHLRRRALSRTSCSIRSTTSRWPTSRRCGSCSSCTKAKRRACSKLYDPEAPDKKRFPLLPAYDQVLKCSNLFNTLDARGAISVTERVGVIQRVRKLAVGVAQAWADQQTPRCRGGGGAMSLPFLLEIGTEEIPDWMIPGGARKSAPAVREARRSRTNRSRLDATPRRLVLRAEGLPERQADSEERVLGPAKSAPAQAVAGFARKQGVEAGRPRRRDHAQGRILQSSCSKVAGRATRDILAEALPGIILQIYFPKTMYWTGKGGPRFIRPIRWIVALLGEEIVPFEIAGVHSGALTERPSPPGRARDRRHHRRLRAAPARPLRDSFRRRAAQEDRAASWPACASSRDPALLETLVYLTEYPTPITGSFDPQFLDLPEEVLITVMRHHQKYFSVEDADGQAGAAVRRGDEYRLPIPKGFVRRGNERVLRARFNDARFFWETDQKKKLADRVDGSGPRHLPGQAGQLPGKDRAHAVDAGAPKLGGDDATPSRAASFSQVRSHHRAGQGIHRTAGRGGRPLRPRPGRAGRRLAGHLRPLQAGEHGRLDPAPPHRPDRGRSPTSSIRCAAASASA